MSPRTHDGRQEAGGRRRISVLCIDNSVGFGGATKSMALMLRDVPDIDPVVLTSQDADLRTLWYSRWPTYTYRRALNYQTRWRFLDRFENTPRIMRTLASKAYAVADTLAALSGAVRIARLARKHKAEVIHLANGFIPLEAIFAGRLAGVPVIAHMRGFFGSVRRAQRKPFALPALVIGDSEAVTQSFIRNSPYAIPSTTLYEVVDVANLDASAHRREEKRLDLGIAEEQIAVAIFGRVVEWKGQREFVTAMLDAMQRDPRLVGVIVGDASDGTRAYFDDIKGMITRSGLGDRFRLTGYVEDVEPLYGAMDVIVHASIEPEPCGMVVMEGMAARRPVIAADAGGPRELIRDGVDGRRVAPGDTAALARTILELAADADLRARMGESGYHRAKALFDLPVATERLRSIYEALSAGSVPIEAAPPEVVLAAR